MSYTNQQIAKQIASLLNKNKTPIFQKGTTSSTGINKELTVRMSNGKVVRALGWNVSTPGEVNVFWDAQNKRYVAWKEETISLKRKTILANRKTRPDERSYLWEYFIKVLQPSSLEGFDADVALDLTGYTPVGITNTGDGYFIVLGNENDTYIFVETDTVFSQVLTDNSYFSYGYSGGNNLRRTFQINANQLSTTSTNTTGSFPFLPGYASIGDNNNYIGYVQPSTSIENIVGSFFGVGYSVRHGFNQGATSAADATGFSASYSSTRSNNRTFQYGGYENKSGSCSTSFTGSITQDVDSPFRDMTYRQATASATTSATIDSLINSKRTHKLLTKNGVEPSGETTTYISQNESITTSLSFNFNETTPSGDVFSPSTGGVTQTQSLTYSGTREEVRDVPIYIYGQHVIKDKILKSTTYSGSASQSLSITPDGQWGSLYRATGMEPVNTNTINGAYSPGSFELSATTTTEEEWEQWDFGIDGVDCAYYMGYIESITVNGSVDINTNKTSSISPEIAYIEPNGINFTRSVGWSAQHMGKSKTEGSLTTKGLNAASINIIKYFIGEDTYTREYLDGHSIFFIAERPDIVELENLVESSLLDLRFSNGFNYSYLSINTDNSWNFHDEIVLSASNTFNDLYGYPNYSYSAYGETAPATGSIVANGSTKINNPQKLSFYDGAEVDIYVKGVDESSNYVVKKYEGILNISYYTEQSQLFSNNYNGIYLDDGFSVTLTTNGENVGYFFGQDVNYLSPNWVFVVYRDDYTSLLVQIANLIEYGNLTHNNVNLYKTLDESGNETVELAIAEIPTTTTPSTLRADIYRFNTSTLKWERRPNAITPVSPLTEVSEFVSYHPTASNSRKKRNRPPRS